MKGPTVLGYKDLFGKPKTGEYLKLMQKLPSNIAISLLAALNNELNSKEEQTKLQFRILWAATTNIPVDDLSNLKENIMFFFQKTNRKSLPIFFASRYILEMVLEEINNYKAIEEINDNQEDLNFLKAYFLIVDKVNDRDHQFIDFGKLGKNEPETLFKLLWLPSLNQFEFNEKPNIIFETFRTLCYFKFIGRGYKTYLREFLDNLKYKNVSTYLGCFQNLFKSIELNDETALLKRLVYIVPEQNVDQTHLQELCIKPPNGNLQLTIKDLKKHPIYFNNSRGYIVLDYTYLTKKMFRGAYFEIVHNTSLTKNLENDDPLKNKIYNRYSQDVADSFEQECFVPIMKLLAKKRAGVFHYADTTAGVPDFYIRKANKIFLFELKAYVFPETLSNDPDFEKIKKYLDTKFVKSERKKPKGVGQLVEQIKVIQNGGFSFDKLSEKIDVNSAEIYPCIVHSDYNFQLPGINTYLNQKFQKNLKPEKNSGPSIAPLTLIGIETILDLAITNFSVLDLGKYIENFHQYLHEENFRFYNEANQQNFLRANSSFDQFYNLHLAKSSKKDHNLPKNLNMLLKIAKINLSDFEQL